MNAKIERGGGSVFPPNKRIGTRVGDWLGTGKYFPSSTKQYLQNVQCRPFWVWLFRLQKCMLFKTNFEGLSQYSAVILVQNKRKKESFVTNNIIFNVFVKLFLHYHLDMITCI